MISRLRLGRLLGLLSVVLAGFAPGVADAQEIVDFQSADGTPLTGGVFKPDGAGPFPGVIMLHGCSGMLTKSRRLKKRESAWAKIFTDEGYAVLLADSFTARGHGSICRIKMRPIKPERERPFDAYGALRWFQGQPFVRADRVALAGWSNGAMAVLWTVRDRQPARPPDQAPDFVAAVAFYPGCIALRRAARDYRPVVPVLVQMGADDNWTLPEPCAGLVEETNRRAGKKVMEIDLYDGAHHSFDHPSLELREIVSRNSALEGGERRVTVGTNREAREKSIRRVVDWLRPRLTGN